MEFESKRLFVSLVSSGREEEDLVFQDKGITQQGNVPYMVPFLIVV